MFLWVFFGTAFHLGDNEFIIRAFDYCMFRCGSHKAMVHCMGIPTRNRVIAIHVEFTRQYPLSEFCLKQKQGLVM